MAAPGKTSQNLCVMCSTALPAGATTCPECGAPIGSATLSDAEAAVYPDIARANLARMRGDYKAAEDQLLAILRKFPNNPSVNEMLGDLAMEREDVPHALEWYQLALEIIPTSASIARKLKNARASLDKKDSSDTVEQLGISRPGASSSAIWIVLAVVGFLVVAIGAYYVGANRNTAAQKEAPPTIINAEAQPEQTTPQQPDVKTGNDQPLRAGDASEMATLLQALKAKSEDSAAVTSLAQDPRTNTLTVEFTFPEKDGRAMAARIGRDAMSVATGASIVTVKGVSGGKVVYMADLYRSKVEETLTTTWTSQHEADPDAWIPFVLTNEWPQAQAAPTSEPAATGATAGSGGSATPMPPVETGSTATGG